MCGGMREECVVRSVRGRGVSGACDGDCDDDASDDACDDACGDA